MRTLPAYVFAVLGVVCVASGAWLLIAGRNFPGVLGRGFTDGDRLRMGGQPARSRS